jgi:hypothetical protein
MPCFGGFNGDPKLKARARSDHLLRDGLAR